MGDEFDQILFVGRVITSIEVYPLDNFHFLFTDLSLKFY